MFSGVLTVTARNGRPWVSTQTTLNARILPWVVRPNVSMRAAGDVTASWLK